MLQSSEGLVQRRAHVNHSSGDGGGADRRSPSGDRAQNDAPNEDDFDDRDDKQTRLTLMEEVLLLGLKDREVSFW